MARLHVSDTALAELCKWECNAGTDVLFPFDVVKKCDEIHKTKKLGRPSFRPYKTYKAKSFVPSIQEALQFTNQVKDPFTAFLRSTRGGRSLTKLPSNTANSKSQYFASLYLS